MIYIVVIKKRNLVSIHCLKVMNTNLSYLEEVWCRKLKKLGIVHVLWQLLLFCMLNRVPPLQCDLACLWQEPKLGGASWSVIYSWLLYPRVSFCLQGPLSFLKLFAVLGQWTQIQPSVDNHTALPWYVWPSPEQKTPLRDLNFQHPLRTF